MPTCVAGWAATASALLAFALGGCGGGGGAPDPEPLPDTSPWAFEQVDLEAGQGALRVATGDLDGDGRLDLAVLRAGSASVGLYLKQGPGRASGAGGYAARAHALVWDTAQDLVLADLDRDGALDVVVAGGAAAAVGVWRGDPTRRGALLPASFTALSAPASRVSVGDVNRDGLPDLVTLDESAGRVRLLLGTPAGPFAAGPDPLAVGACVGLTLVDVDRDGRLDAVTNRPGLGAAAVWFDVGAAPAATVVPLPLVCLARVAVGDVTGDGWPDIVCAGRSGGGGVGGAQVLVLAQDPRAPRSFAPLLSPPADLDEDRLAIADFNRDGLADLALEPLDPASPFDGFLSPGDPAARGLHLPGSFSNYPRGAKPPSRAHLLGVADLDGDGQPDLIGARADGGGLRLTYVSDRVPPGPPVLHEERRLEPQSGVAVAVADLDRDGVPDLLTADGPARALSVRYGDPAAAGGYLAPVRYPFPVGSDLVAVVAADLDRDGRLDVVLADRGASALRTLTADPSDARRLINPAVLACNAPPRGVAVADLDRDGTLDLAAALAGTPGLLRIFGGSPAQPGTFAFAYDVALPLAEPADVAAGDLDGDGAPGLAVVADGTLASVLLRRTALPLSAGPQAWSVSAPLALLSGVRVALGDLDGDGRSDLVTAGAEGVLVALQDPVERGRFLPSFALTLATCSDLALGDIDRDGRLDVAWNELFGARVRVAAPDADGDALEIASALNGLPPGTPVRLARADVDGDGREELVLVAPTGGAGGGALVILGQ